MLCYCANDENVCLNDPTPRNPFIYNAYRCCFRIGEVFTSSGYHCQAHDLVGKRTALNAQSIFNLPPISTDARILGFNYSWFDQELYIQWEFKGGRVPAMTFSSCTARHMLLGEYTFRTSGGFSYRCLIDAVTRAKHRRYLREISAHHAKLRC